MTSSQTLPAIINDENYRAFPAVSNSDLGEILKIFIPPAVQLDLEVAYANGTLIDAMITEPHRVNFFKLTVEGEKYKYSQDEFAAAKEMKKSFYRDPFCVAFAKQCKFQHISYNPNFQVEHEGFKFNVPGKCKWDMYRDDIDLSGDIKSTVCTKQSQVEECVRHFHYDRSRAWYMDLDSSIPGRRKRNNDILIFISKKNFQVFKIKIQRDDKIFKDGKRKYQDLAFKYWSLLADIKPIN